MAQSDLLKQDRSVTILAIESSCDETSAAVVVNGRDVLSNVIFSQIDIHKVYGGVVPEIASRSHIEKINQVIREALDQAQVTLDEIDAVAVTYGPGLVGPLLVGVSEAKAIAVAKRKPLVGVHHIKGHICANYIEHPDLKPPYLCLVVSGGHTHLVYVADYTLAKRLIKWQSFIILVTLAALLLIILQKKVTQNLHISRFLSWIRLPINMMFLSAALNQQS